MPTLGVFVLSVQGMKHLDQCLESVRWADVVIVLHVGDGEPSLGASLRSSLDLRKIASLDEARRLSQDARSDWILHLWGEERVEGELANALSELCQGKSAGVPSAYRIPIRSYLLDRWAEGSLWGPSPALRLSHKSEGIGYEWWHAEAEVESFPQLRGWIGDYSAVELSEGVSLLQSLSGLWARQLLDKGQSLNLAALLLPLRVFIRLLLLNGVFSHGLAGLTLSTLAAYGSLLSAAKVWEARNLGGGKKTVGQAR